LEVAIFSFTTKATPEAIGLTYIFFIVVFFLSNFGAIPNVSVGDDMMIG
jgi:hypothetical protein